MKDQIKANYVDRLLFILQAEYGNGAECFSQSKLALMLMMNKLSRDLDGESITAPIYSTGALSVPPPSPSFDTVVSYLMLVIALCTGISVLNLWGDNLMCDRFCVMITTEITLVLSSVYYISDKTSFDCGIRLLSQQ